MIQSTTLCSSNNFPAYVNLAVIYISSGPSVIQRPLGAVNDFLLKAKTNIDRRILADELF